MKSTYQYERIECDSHVKLQLDVLSHRALALVYILAAFAFLVCIAVTACAPDVFQMYSGTIYHCDYVPEAQSENCMRQWRNSALPPQWTGRLGSVGPMNQFLLISADVYSSARNSSASAVEFDLDVGVSLFAEGSDEASVEVLSSRTITHRIKCTKGKAKCTSLFLAYEPFVEYSTYKVIISIENWQQIERFISKVKVKAKAVESEFSKYQMYVKGAFLLLSLFSLIVYLSRLLRSGFQTWSTETRGLAFVSVSCVLFNDPFFALSLKYPHVVLTSLSVASVVQFVGFLVHFWSTILIEIRSIAYSSTLRVGMSVYLAVLCSALIGIYVYSAILMKNDPSYLLADFPKSVAAIAILTLVMTGVFVLWLGFLTYRALPWYERAVKRKKFLSAINFVMSLFTASCIAAGFLQRTPSAAPAVLFVLGAFNIYTVLLQVLFVPTTHRIQEVLPGTELTPQHDISMEIEAHEESKQASEAQSERV